MKPAIWFSRHQPTAEQIADARNMGFEIIEIQEGMRAGAANIDNLNQLDAAIDYLQRRVKETGASAVFGVFPVPVLAVFRLPRLPGIPLYSSWNINRAAEGQAPQFIHSEWLIIAEM